MLIGGLQKTTLIDFPEKIACTVFTVGCNFRCPFCHNRDLVTRELFNKSGIKTISEEEFFEFLKKRKKWLDGVCITGGEPTIQADLPEFCRKIKEMGLAVKLDTNGTRPEVLERLLKEGLLDYVAMDIKGPLDEEYGRASGVKSQKSKVKSYSPKLKILENIKKSIKILVNSGVGFELRTTVVPTLQTRESLVRMAEQVKEEVKSPKSKVKSIIWYLQTFRPRNCLDPEFEKIKSYSDEEMKRFVKEMKKVMPGVKSRGT